MKIRTWYEEQEGIEKKDKIYVYKIQLKDKKNDRKAVEKP